MSRSFPRAILHVDGDAFFASCEVAKDPSLRGRPVITGAERGIVSAATYEAKARGIKRGMRLFEARKVCPDAVILPSDYETYSLFSERMYAIVRRYTPSIEEYSIDECFADLTGLRRLHRASYPDIAMRIKNDLQRELNLTFSLGLGPTKVIAKLGSKWRKPDGFTVIPLSEVEKYLARTQLPSVWGIGPNTAAYLTKLGLRSALQFTRKEEAWVKERVNKPIYEIWRELRGEVVYDLATGQKESYQSIGKTKTFTPPSTDPAFIYAQLSKNIENACIKARRFDLAAPEAFFFLKTQDFRYYGFEVKMPHPTNLPNEVLDAVAGYFPRVFRKGRPYRATGVVLCKLEAAGARQLDLFGARQRSEGLRKVYESVDQLSEKYGKHAVFLASSFEAMRRGAHLGEREGAPSRSRNLFKGETKRRRLAIPMLGEVG